MKTVSRTLGTDLGLVKHTTFYRDFSYLLAILGGAAVVIAIRVLLPTTVGKDASISFLVVFNSIVWFPVVEELLFRGVIQGQLYRIKGTNNLLLGLSYSNWITSFLFAAVHFFYHPPLWAISVIVPSLVFGYFRDRYISILPTIALHSIYNAQYLFVLG